MEQMNEWLDESGEYPSDAAIERIKAFDVMQTNEALDFVASIWHWPDFGVSHELRPHERECVHADEGEKFLRLATGGWSGNEEIVSAFDESMASFGTWCMSTSGGLHIYRYREQPASAAR